MCVELYSHYDFTGVVLAERIHIMFLPFILGLHLACGLHTGEIVFLHPTTIEILTDKPFKDTEHAIKEINYSPDSLTMAFSVSSFPVFNMKFTLVKLIYIEASIHYKSVNRGTTTFSGHRQNSWRLQV